MLEISEEVKSIGKFVNMLSNFTAILGKLIPIDKAILTNNLKNLSCIFFDGINSDIGHVEIFNILIKSINSKINILVYTLLSLEIEKVKYNIVGF